MVKKQDGMTLVEVMATLLLSSLVILLIWTSVATSMKYNLAETKKMRMQQEVNYIITDIQRIHRNYECYQITSNDDYDIWRVSKCSSGEDIAFYSNLDYRYIIDGPSEEIYTRPFEGKNYTPSYRLSIKVYKIDNDDDDKPNLEVETFISRFEE